MLSLCDGKVVTFVSGLCTTLDCAGGDRTRGEAQLLKIPLLPHPCLHYHFRGFGHNFDRSVLEDVSFVRASGRGAYVSCLGSMCHISEQGIVKVANLQSIASDQAWFIICRTRFGNEARFFIFEKQINLSTINTLFDMKSRRVQQLKSYKLFNEIVLRASLVKGTAPRVCASRGA